MLAVSVWPTCAWAFAVGPLATGLSLPVIFFSAAVICDMKFELIWRACLEVREKERVLWLLRSLVEMMLWRNAHGGVEVSRALGRAKRKLRFIRRNLDAIFGGGRCDVVVILGLFSTTFFSIQMQREGSTRHELVLYVP